MGVVIAKWCVIEPRLIKALSGFEEPDWAVKVIITVEGWDIDVGPCQMCRRLQSEEYDLVYGGTRFVGPLLECGEERGIKKGVWKRLWRGRDICGKDGRYWVEK